MASMRLVVIGLMAASLAVGAAAGRFAGVSGGLPSVGAAAPPAAPARPEQPPAAVETTTVGRSAVERSLSAIGTLRAVQSVPIASLTGGVVTAANFTEGGFVEPGAALVEFDRRIAAAQLEAAEGQLRVAQTRFQRGQELSAAGIRSRQAQDDDRAALQQAQSEFAVRRTTLDQLTLRAPFRGIAGQRLFGMGEYVPAGKTLLWLEDRSTLRIDFQVPERFLPVLRIGQTFDLEVDAVPGRRFVGRTVLIDSRPDLSARAIHVRGDIPNNGLELPSGVFGRVRLVIDRDPDALVLPPSAVQFTMTGAFVFRVEHGRARRVPVRVGIQMADRVQVLDGLSVGDVVVTAGQINLDEGRRVTVTAEVAGPR